MGENYVETKLEFVIYYRETELFNGTGKGVSPDPVRPYILDKYTVELSNQTDHSVAICDTGSQLDYTHVIVVLDKPDPTLTQIRLNTNFGSGSGMWSIGNNFSKLSNSMYVLTKEIAELYNQSFQTSDKTYLIDIKQFIDTYVKLFMKNHIEAMSGAQNIFSDYVPEESPNQSGNNPNINMSGWAIMQTNMYHKMEEFRLQESTMGIHSFDTNPITKLKIYLTLTFDAPYKGNVTVYLF